MTDSNTQSTPHVLCLTYVLLFCLLFLISQGNFLLYHSIAEMFSIAVAWSVFILLWSTRRMSATSSFIFIGMAFLFTGILDLIHTLSYDGMNIFYNVDGSNTATQFWIAARLMEAVSLLFFPIMIRKKLKVPVMKVMMLYTLLTALIIYSIFYTNFFPDCFVAGTGLTQFKIFAEYTICLILFASIYLLYGCRNKMDRKVYIFLMLSLSVSIASELAFTIYTDVYGISNAVGHFLKILTFGLIFQALVYSSVHRPYSTIFMDLKKDTEELTISHTLHSSLIANISDVLVILDENAEIKYISPNIKTLFGWNPEDRIGRPVWTNIHPDYVGMLTDAFTELLLEKGSSKTIEIQYKCSDGNYNPVEMSGRNLLDDPAIKGFLINFHDISEKKESERQLHDSEERFRALHNASFGGIAIHDKGVILECNLGLTDISGFEYSELIGMNGLYLIAEADRDQVMKKIGSGYEKAYEVNGLRKNGEEYPLRLEARNIPYKGKPVRVVEFRDISREKQDEAEKNRLKESLMHIQKMETVGRLAGGIAHDFNNMLGIIMGYTDLILENEGSDGPNSKYLKEIKTASQRSADLTSQLLGFARKQIIDRRILNLNETVKPMIEMLDRLSGEQIELSWNPGKDAGKVKIDPNQLNQILVNLCMNAKDEMEGKGKISINTGSVFVTQNNDKNWEDFSPGKYTTLSIKDSSTAINEKRKKSIFEPFSMIDNEETDNTGLSLAAVYGCTRQNGGFIKLESEKVRGNTFTIFLPSLMDKE